MSGRPARKGGDTGRAKGRPHAEAYESTDELILHPRTQERAMRKTIALAVTITILAAFQVPAYAGLTANGLSNNGLG